VEVSERRAADLLSAQLLVVPSLPDCAASKWLWSPASCSSWGEEPAPQRTSWERVSSEAASLPELSFLVAASVRPQRGLSVWGYCHCVV